MPEKLNIAVALSGGGRTLENFFEKIDSNELKAEITSVAASNSKAFGLERARKHGVATGVFLRGDFEDDEAYSLAIMNFFRERPCDLVVLAGFMKFFYVTPDWQDKVMNVHPALIPAFCGDGLYGSFVHEAVIKSGVKITGCTVHFVDNVYDHGPIIVQRAVPVYDTDTPDDVATRVFEEECVAYVEAIKLFQEERLKTVNGTVRILPL